MARNIGEDLATLTSPGYRPWQRWGRLLGSQHGGIRLYQWLWVILCVVGALAVATPRVLSQPVVFYTAAETHFDTSRYTGLYHGENPSPDLQTAMGDATFALRMRSLARRELRFGQPDYRVEYVPVAPGVIRVDGFGPTATEAQALADAGAEELVRQIRAAGGREVMRNLLGWELVVAMRSEPMTSPFEYHLRAILEHDAFPMSRPVEPVAGRMDVETLPYEEQNDLTRALEARYDLWTFEMSHRDATLDGLCGTSGLLTTAEREAALASCALQDPAAELELTARNRAIAGRDAIEAALRYMIDQQGMRFDPVAQSATYRVAAPWPAAPEDRSIALTLAMAVVLGLTLGLTGVAVDRSAGLMLRLQELWRYRELTINMVIRDLRARYKGSTLGYLWTQLAPLLMMLIFLFVFSFLFPSNIALYSVFLIVGLLPWNFCSEAITSGTRSVLDNAHLIKKVFFPREVLPLVSVISSLVNFVLSLPMMFVVMAVAQLMVLGHLNFSWTFAYLPVVILLQTIFLIGMTFWLSCLAVFFRDTVHLIGILVQFWFFLTPVFYSLDYIGAPLDRIIRWLNPMASIIDFYREILYGNAVPVGMVPTPGVPALDSVLRVLLTALVLFAFGAWFFQRHSGRFGEEL
ncbi:MAG: ABC transporter permease [Chloroflexaceae bacterium]|nr:ABC transporter permease [Chloroflexaceae bacterium]